MMEYNTKQKKLPLPEYGRSVQKMVDHALGIEHFSLIVGIGNVQEFAHNFFLSYMETPVLIFLLASYWCVRLL